MDADEVGLIPRMPSAMRTKRREQVRSRDGNAPCWLRSTPDCQAVGGAIDYDAKPPHPRSFEIDHVVTRFEASKLGWTFDECHSLENLMPSCRQCNRDKSDGIAPATTVRPTYVNPRFT